MYYSSTIAYEKSRARAYAKAEIQKWAKNLLIHEAQQYLEWWNKHPRLLVFLSLFDSEYKLKIEAIKERDEFS